MEKDSGTNVLSTIILPDFDSIFFFYTVICTQCGDVCSQTNPQLCIELHIHVNKPSPFTIIIQKLNKLIFFAIKGLKRAHIQDLVTDFTSSKVEVDCFCSR